LPIGSPPSACRAPGTERGNRRLRTAIELLVSEALTNVANYARATAATVSVARTNDRLLVEVGDDGVGGASIEAGSGLRGLADRG